MPAAVTEPADAGCAEDERYLLELEFVQCLSNPQYLNCAAPSSTLLHEDTKVAA